MKDKVFIINAIPYSVPDERTGVLNEGISFHYCMTGDFKPTAEENGFQGFRVLKGSVPIRNKEQLKSVPGFYDVEFDVVIDSKTGKAVLKPLSFVFVKALQ